MLTVIGTIGFEYPLFNIPVINASKKSSTLKFNFNIHVDNINYYTFRYNVYTDQTSKLYHKYVDVLSCLTYQELICFKNMLYLVWYIDN